MQTETWHDENATRLRITCDDHCCLLEVTVASTSDCELVVEILNRPNSTFGIPAGSPYTVHRQTVTAHLNSENTATARLWLPSGLNFAQVRNLFYRLSRVSDREHQPEG